MYTHRQNELADMASRELKLCSSIGLAEYRYVQRLKINYSLNYDLWSMHGARGFRWMPDGVGMLANQRHLYANSYPGHQPVVNNFALICFEKVFTKDKVKVLTNINQKSVLRRIKGNETTTSENKNLHNNNCFRYLILINFYCN